VYKCPPPLSLLIWQKLQADPWSQDRKRNKKSIRIRSMLSFVWQVKAVFELLTPSLGLAVGLAVGQTSLAGEAQQLVAAGRHTLRQFTPESSSTAAESNVDILVCTPGRLMDHVHDTPGFTLQHLRYLVRQP
jgi:superfamily II DNA/RNA helicase